MITKEQIVRVEKPYFVKGGNLRIRVHFRQYENEPVKSRVFNVRVCGDYDDRAALCPALEVRGFTASDKGGYYSLAAGDVTLPAETWQALGNRHVENFINNMAKYSDTFNRMGRQKIAQCAIDEINAARERLGWAEKFEYTGYRLK